MKHKRIWKNCAIWILSLFAWRGIIWLEDKTNAGLFPLIFLGMFVCSFAFYNLIKTEGFKDWYKQFNVKK